MTYRTPLPGGHLPQAKHGRAGAGLGSNSARTKFGKQGEIGASGERHFAQMLQRAGLDETYDILYSLSIPQGRNFGAKSMVSDVDVALLNGNQLVLVDVKRWAGSGIFWSMGGLPFRDLAPLTLKGKWKMSANMATAVRRYKETLPGVHVTAMVVFVPTQRGTAPASVRWLKWPGGIRSFLAPAAIKELRSRLGATRVVPAAQTMGVLHALERG